MWWKSVRQGLHVVNTQYSWVPPIKSFLEPHSYRSVFDWDLASFIFNHVYSCFLNKTGVRGHARGSVRLFSSTAVLWTEVGKIIQTGIWPQTPPDQWYWISPPDVAWDSASPNRNIMSAHDLERSGSTVHQGNCNTFSCLGTILLIFFYSRTSSASVHVVAYVTVQFDTFLVTFHTDNLVK